VTGGRDVRFLDSMPRPLLVSFLALAAGGIGLVLWIMLRPPEPPELPLAERRSPPRGTFTHHVVRARPVDVPSPLPAFRPPCPEVAGVVVEGGPPAQERIGRVLRSLCRLVRPGLPAEAAEAVRALGRARIRFALFTRTGDQSTLDLATGRILLAVALSRTNVAPVVIAPLLVHEGWHLARGGPVTAAEEYGARVAELQACELLIEADRFPRGCRDAAAIVGLGEARAVELLVRAGFPR
jgi:hypothetical protein